jgi:Xaa-Pro aminopeptidase
VTIQQEKTEQVKGILKELDIDVWLVFARESMVNPDPVLPLIMGTDIVWQSFFLYTSDGRAIALVGNFDQENLKRCGFFSKVETYTEDPQDLFLQMLKKTNPRKIAVNFSRNDPAADGLSHGMYLLLLDYLKATPYSKCLVSAEEIIQKLRGKKTESEIRCLSRVANATVDAWNAAVLKIITGMTEKEIGNLIDTEISSSGGTNSFPTIVNAGSKTSPGHSKPTDAKLEGGDLLHVDFGMKLDGYCSDLQRLIYFKKHGEDNPPIHLIKAFNTVRDIITASAENTVPGITGAEVDTRARQMLARKGYEEYRHALGHQLGRTAHDGGAIIGPHWHRYGNTPDIKLEAGNVFTLELEIMLPEIGCVGLEEDIVIVENGPARFLCNPQTELIVK